MRGGSASNALPLKNRDPSHSLPRRVPIAFPGRLPPFPRRQSSSDKAKLERQGKALAGRQKLPNTSSPRPCPPARALPSHRLSKPRAKAATFAQKVVPFPVHCPGQDRLLRLWRVATAHRRLTAAAHGAMAVRAMAVRPATLATAHRRLTAVAHGPWQSGPWQSGRWQSGRWRSGRWHTAIAYSHGMAVVNDHGDRPDCGPDCGPERRDRYAPPGWTDHAGQPAMRIEEGGLGRWEG